MVPPKPRKYKMFGDECAKQLDCENLHNAYEYQFTTLYTLNILQFFYVHYSSVELKFSKIIILMTNVNLTIDSMIPIQNLNKYFAKVDS